MSRSTRLLVVAGLFLSSAIRIISGLFFDTKIESYEIYFWSSIFFLSIIATVMIAFELRNDSIKQKNKK